MMPCRSCSGEKLMEDSGPAVSHGTLRRVTPASGSAGRPYGRSTTPGPIDCDHGASAGGEAEAAWEGFVPSARLPVSAAPRPSNERRASGFCASASLDTRGQLRHRSDRTFPRFAGLPLPGLFSSRLGVSTLWLAVLELLRRFEMIAIARCLRTVLFGHN